MDANKYDWMPIEYLEDVVIPVLTEERERIKGIARKATAHRDARLDKGEARKKATWDLKKEKETFRRRLFGGA